MTRQRRRPGVDDDQARAVTLSLAHVRHQMNAGRRGVGAPDDDQPRGREILIRDRCHFPVERHVGDAGGSCADRSRQLRRAEPAEQRRIARVLRQQSVGAAIGVRQDRFTAPLRARIPQPLGDEIQRVVPAGAYECALTLGSRADGGMTQPVGAVDTLAEPAHLGADVPSRDGIAARAVYFGNASVLDDNLERT